MGHPLPREWNRGHGVGKFQLPEGLSHQYAQISPSRPGMASHRQDLEVVPAVGLGVVSPQVNQASEENQWQKKIACKDRYCVPIYQRLVIRCHGTWRAEDQRLKISSPEPASLPSHFFLSLHGHCLCSAGSTFGCCLPISPIL